MNKTVDNEATHDTVMSFGKYKGVSLRDVPASYLLWLYDQFPADHPISLYVKRHRDNIDKQAEEDRKEYLKRKRYRTGY